MYSLLFDCLAGLSAAHVARIRLIGMLAVLVIGLTSGYLASSRFGLSEHLAKKIMTIVMICFNWLIALLVIWSMNLSRQLIWLPIVGVVLMLVITVLSAVIFHILEHDRKKRLTLILAGAISNTGYTGGAFVCYALFGMMGLALANIYLLLCLPVFYLVYLPFLKFRELRSKDRNAKLNLDFLMDLRMLVAPAIIIAIILNLTKVKQPAFITKFYLIDILVYTASSMSFFAIGLRIKFSRLKNYINLYFPIAAVKFILTPAVALLIIAALKLTGQNLDSLFQKVIIVSSATPSAVLMVTMSNVFDLDGPLASAIWVVTMAVFVAIVVPVLFLLFA
ncbi:MAG: AEC family transporter [Phycisphaerae bacterium]|nr:AEC family transporter [Phycisphaerae bacterium]MDD5381379.1 AEC family transporter [Phycisphaerae bacterium]